MKHKDEEALKKFRGVGCCEWCKEPFLNRQAAHVFAKAMGGANRLDVPMNLVSLCGWCHVQSHAGHEPTQDDLLAVVAAREKMLQPDVERRLRLMMRAPKECHPCALCRGKGCDFCRHAGIFDRNGDPWFEPERKPTWRTN